MDFGQESMEVEELFPEAYLKVMASTVHPNTGTELELRGRKVTLGRSEESNIDVRHPDISRNMCTFDAHNGSWTITNNGRNYIRVGNKRLKTGKVSPLSTGDIINLLPSKYDRLTYEFHEGRAVSAQLKELNENIFTLTNENKHLILENTKLSDQVLASNEQSKEERKAYQDAVLAVATRTCPPCREVLREKMSHIVVIPENAVHTTSEAAGNGELNGSNSLDHPGVSIPNPANEEGNQTDSANHNIPSENGNIGLPPPQQFGGNSFGSMPLNYGTNPFMNTPSANYGLNNQASYANHMGGNTNYMVPNLMAMGMPGTPHEMMAMHFAQQQQLRFQQHQQQMMMYHQAAMLNYQGFPTPQPSGGHTGQDVGQNNSACCDSTSQSLSGYEADDEEYQRRHPRCSMRLLVPERRVNFRNPSVFLPSDDTHGSEQETPSAPGASITTIGDPNNH